MDATRQNRTEQNSNVRRGSETKVGERRKLIERRDRLVNKRFVCLNVLRDDDPPKKAEKENKHSETRRVRRSIVWPAGRSIGRPVSRSVGR